MDHSDYWLNNLYIYLVFVHYLCGFLGGFSTELPCPDPIGLTSMSNEFEYANSPMSLQDVVKLFKATLGDIYDNCSKLSYLNFLLCNCFSFSVSSFTITISLTPWKDTLISCFIVMVWWNRIWRKQTRQNEVGVNILEQYQLSNVTCNFLVI